MEYKILLNQDQVVVDYVRKGLKDNEGYCPCRLIKVDENKCRCLEFKSQKSTGFCHCGLFYKVPDCKYVAVDFDGTIVSHEFPRIGVPNDELIKKLRLMHSSGIKIILHTCREDGEVDFKGNTHNYLTEAINWCKLNNVPVDAVNENPWVTFGGRKIYADIYIDDRGFNISDIEML